ncbi:tyrosine-protein phosphatase [Pediococcus argentinicus]|nr:tyrosine-protein phosphatase [Pediococcus argentinicus]NKZ22209.1 tyrosine-protein phosphatase [Pediococcus argentinicus]GEP19260.1 protein-tyrosine-phosphatase [Pediococcus argentinicus]
MKRERILNVEGAVNFRELGGYPTIDNKSLKWQKLLRSGELARLSKKALRNLDEYGLKYDIDLRSPAEVEWVKDRIPKDTIYRSYPVYPIRDGEQSDLPKQVAWTYQAKTNYYDPYLLMVLGDHPRVAFRQMFIDMLDNSGENQSLLFHCAAGKDRTGIGALIILSVLGVPYDIIKQDYLLTNVVYNSYDQDQLRHQLNHQHVSDVINEMNSNFQVQSHNLDQANQAVLDEFGTWQNYFIKALEFSEDDLADLKKLYLE